MEILLEIDGGDTSGVDLDELKSIIQRDDDLRSSRVEIRFSSPTEGAMGPVTDGVLVVLESGGAGMALLRLIGEWMRNRRSKVRIKLTSKSRTLEVDLDAVDAPDKAAAILRALKMEG